MTVTGDRVVAGRTESPFTLMSVSKPFVFALVAEEVGLEDARRRVGVNPTGMAFDSASAIERATGGRTNPRRGGSG